MRTKLTLTLLLVFFLSLSSVQAGTISKPPYLLTLKSGLVGHWTFDGANVANGVIRDISGQGNHSNTNGIATSTFYSVGKLGQAGNFDGVNDYVITNTAPPTPSIAYTQSAWVKLDRSVTGYPVIMGMTNTFKNSLWINIGSAYTNVNSVSVGDAGNSPDLVTTGANSFSNDGNWHHIVAVVPVGTTVTPTIYIDGVSVAVSGTINSVGGTFNGVTIGQLWQRTASYWFKGMMDDVRVYSRALTASEITQLYNFGASKLGVTKTPTGLQSGLVGHWTFDGKDMLNGVARDISGQGNDGNTISIATSTFYTVGKIGQGVQFDGVDDIVNVGSASVLDDTSPVTYSAWVYPRSTGAGAAGTLLYKTNKSLSIASGKWRFSQSCSGTSLRKDSSSSIVLNTWTHLLVTWDGGTLASGIKVYVNGVLDEGSTQNCGGTFLSDGSFNMNIGSRGGSNGFDGTLDDVRIYSRVLSASEITQLYTLGASKLGVTKTPTGLQSGLVGHWTFDGKDMPNGVVRDISGQGNNGSASGIATSTFYTVGKSGQALQFDGVDDYVNVGTLGAFGASNGQAQMQQGSTVSLWVKTTNTTNIMTVIGNSNANDTLAGFGISINRGPFGMINGSIRVSWTQTSNWGSIYTADAPGINDGNWHHIVAVHKVTGTQELWVDGQSKTTASGRSLFSTFQSWSISPGLGIGAEITAAGTAQDYFRGSIDDVRIYNRTLSAAEIAQLYGTGR